MSIMLQEMYIPSGVEEEGSARVGREGERKSDDSERGTPGSSASLSLSLAVCDDTTNPTQPNLQPSSKQYLKKIEREETRGRPGAGGWLYARPPSPLPSFSASGSEKRQKEMAIPVRAQIWSMCSMSALCPKAVARLSPHSCGRRVDSDGGARAGLSLLFPADSLRSRRCTI